MTTPNSTPHRLIRPSPQRNSGRSQGQGKERNKQVVKRTQITSIACMPCQQRKSKCDGGRPVCQSCLLKCRPNCFYDFDGDQRRTSALKSRLGDMQQEVDQLKSIVHTLACCHDLAGAQCLAQDFEAAQYRILSPDNFDSVLRGWNASAQADHKFDDDMRGRACVGQIMHAQSPPSRNPGVNASYGYGNGSLPDVGLPTPTSPTSHDQWAFRPRASEGSSVDPMTRSMSMSGMSSSRSASSHRTTEEQSSVDHHYTPQGSGSRGSGDEFVKRSPDSSVPKAYRYWFKPAGRSAYLQYYGETPYANGYDNSMLSEAGFCGLSLPIHSMLPLQEMDPGALSRSYTDFCEEKRRLIKVGWPIGEVLGPNEVDRRSVLMDESVDGNLSVASWAVAIVRAIGGMNVPEKLATTFMHTRLMRWLILPTVESYENLPECMKPTPTQLCVPHPAWIDFVAWPEIRDTFINCPEVLIGKDHLVPFSLNTSVNWPHSVAEMTGFDLLTNEVQLSSSFERYVEDINNWSLGPYILSHFPMLHEKAWIKEDDKLKGRSASNTDSVSNTDFAF